MSKSRIVLGIVIGAVVAAGIFLLLSGKGASAGPYGGDVVPIDGDRGYAELVANGDTGEVMVHTWANDLKTSRPIVAEPLRLGTDQGEVQLAPHPLRSDPAGYCSRFYGHADWLRGSAHRRGWLALGEARHAFEWKRCWEAGRAHGPMWDEMGEHRWRGMGHGEARGPGADGPR